jgi:hypothetical protein
VPFVYELAPGDINSASASFYVWGKNRGLWHPVGSGYTPKPGDVAIYGLNTDTAVAQHIAVVTASGSHGPDVVNGDGDQTGFSVVERASDQRRIHVGEHSWPLSGYVAPSPS